MRYNQIENIPNTFALNCRNKFFSLHSLFFLIRMSAIHYEQLPKAIRKLFDEYLNIREGTFGLAQVPKETQQLFDEYLKSEKTYSTETRNELK